MNGRHKAARKTPKAPIPQLRWRATAGGPQINVFQRDVLDATHFALGTQRVVSVRPLTTTPFPRNKQDDVRRPGILPVSQQAPLARTPGIRRPV